jgi:hypothetical protein
MTMNDLEHDKELFELSARGYWAAVHAKKPRLADKATAEGDRIVHRWHQIGSVELLLGPLLDSSDDEVRYAAAAHLAGLRVSEARSVEVLTSLSGNPDGLIAPTARLLLMQLRRRAPEC